MRAKKNDGNREDKSVEGIFHWSHLTYACSPDAFALVQHKSARFEWQPLPVSAGLSRIANPSKKVLRAGINPAPKGVMG